MHIEKESLFSSLAEAADSMVVAYRLLKDTKEKIHSKDRLCTLEQISKDILDLVNLLDSDMLSLMEEVEDVKTLS